MINISCQYKELITVKLLNVCSGGYISPRGWKKKQISTMLFWCWNGKQINNNSPSLFSHKSNNLKVIAYILIKRCRLMELRRNHSIRTVNVRPSGGWRVLTAQLMKTVWVVHSDRVNTRNSMKYTLTFNNVKVFKWETAMRGNLSPLLHLSLWNAAALHQTWHPEH